MCRALDIPVSKMRIVNPFVGGGFSGKHDPFDIDFATVKLAQIAGRPVKTVLNYDEVLAAYRQRNAMNAKLKMGLKKNGQITALRTECILEGGPIAGIGPFNIYYSARSRMSRTKSPPSSTTESSPTRTGRRAARCGDRRLCLRSTA